MFLSNKQITDIRAPTTKRDKKFLHCIDTGIVIVTIHFRIFRIKSKSNVPIPFVWKGIVINHLTRTGNRIVNGMLNSLFRLYRFRAWFHTWPLAIKGIQLTIRFGIMIFQHERLIKIKSLSLIWICKKFDVIHRTTPMELWIRGNKWDCKLKCFFSVGTVK